MIGHVRDFDRGLFLHLAADPLFEALARLDEARERRMEPGRPSRLAAEETAVAVVDEHDDGGIGAGEMLRSAFLVGADPHMACVAASRRSAADAAEEMSLVPVGDAARIGE